MSRKVNKLKLFQERERERERERESKPNKIMNVSLPRKQNKKLAQNNRKVYCNKIRQKFQNY